MVNNRVMNGCTSQTLRHCYHGYYWFNCNFTYSFMETIISSKPIDLRLMFVLHVILNMAHLVENCAKILKIIVSGAHFDPEQDLTRFSVEREQILFGY